jgi:hypothetical protein
MMIITTAGKNAEKLTPKAKAVTATLGGQFLNRGNQSISAIMDHFQDDVLMIGVEKISYYPKEGTTPFFFHPNSAMFRVKQLLRGENDPFISAAELKEGMKVLDCTLGLGSDSIVASLVTGSTGEVTGIESSKAISYVVRSGLGVWESNLPEMNEAMRRIQVIHADHFDYLKTLKDECYDVVYFDPMFESTVQSPGIQGLKGSADYRPVSQEVIAEALRVASHRVVMKDSRTSSKFHELGFTPIKRNASFLYGFIEKNSKEKIRSP